ncbi:MAG: protein kinase [Myxococcota bacterium]
MATQSYEDAAEDPMRAKLSHEWRARGIDIATLRLDRNGTIVPSHLAAARIDVSHHSPLAAHMVAGSPVEGAAPSARALGPAARPFASSVPPAPTPWDESAQFRAYPSALPRGVPSEGAPVARPRPTGTIRAEIVDEGSYVPRSGGAARMSQLPPLTAAHLDASTADVELTETIGEGGMGIVWAAKQVPLRREVAVKSVHPAAPLEETARALLREARVTGALEHPNIVPIHALGQDGSGRPLIVMKRIEGTTWTDLLVEHRSRGPGALMRHLDEHLRIMIDVAKAVHFAHCRGIVHRDLKPDNVMIGTFGEVYVVDWGIAVATEAHPHLEVQLAREVDEITGSPAYMAPEMAVGDGPSLSTQTDIYLLGATLHEILTGEPPHTAPSTVGMLTNAYASRPKTYDRTVPVELGAICNEAMARNPNDRFANAAMLAARLQSFLRHRDSTLLSDEARLRLEELRELIAAPDSLEPEAARQRIYSVFNRARFGFEHALKIWEANRPALDRLQACLELMIEYELAHGSPGAAEALLADLPTPLPRLSKRIASRKESERRARHELDELKHRVDPTLTDRPRAVTAFVVAVTWPALHAGLFFVGATSSFAVDHIAMTGLYAVYLVASVAIGIAQRETLLTRAASGLQTQLVNTLAYGALTALWPLCRVLQIGTQASFVLAFFAATILYNVAAISIDRRFAAWGASMLVGLVLTLLFRDFAMLWMGGAGMLGSLVLGVLRMRTKTPEDAFPLSRQWSHARVEEAMATRRADPVEPP